jgi:hypothetical protein
MTKLQAATEIRQYVRITKYECPGAALPRRDWHRPETERRRVSLQTCLPWGGLDFTSYHAAGIYAAQATFNDRLRRLAADAGQIVRRLPRLAPDWPFDGCTPSGRESLRAWVRTAGTYTAFARACGARPRSAA